MNSDPKPVKGCLCHDTSFETLKASGVQTLEEIALQFGCTTGCGLCRPYIEQMLVTGDTEFAVIEDA